MSYANQVRSAADLNLETETVIVNNVISKMYTASENGNFYVLVNSDYIPQWFLDRLTTQGYKMQRISEDHIRISWDQK